MLINHLDFALPGRKALTKNEMSYEVVLIDATESPVERPKKQKSCYSGKKKRHTLRTQVVVDKKTAQIICTATTNGRRHDFRLFKESKTRFHPNMLVCADTGYQGLQKCHLNTELPKKKTGKYPLSKGDKQRNAQIASKRVLCENVIGALNGSKSSLIATETGVNASE